MCSVSGYFLNYFSGFTVVFSEMVKPDNEPALMDVYNYSKCLVVGGKCDICVL